MQRITRWIIIHSLIIVILIGKDAAIAPGYDLSFDYGPQQYATSQRTFRLNDESQQKIGNTALLLDSQQNSTSLKIDLEKGTVDENPFNSLLYNNFSHNSNENSKHYAADLQSANIFGEVPLKKVPSKRSTIKSTKKNIPANFNGLEKISFNASKEESKNFEKTSVKEIGQLASVIGTSAMIDGNSFDFDRTKGTILNVTRRKIEFSTPSHIFKRIPNLAINRTGNLASSHIIDYSAFLTNSPSIETSTIVPDFEIIPSFIKTGISSTQTSESRITENENDSSKITISSTADHTIISDILPLGPLLTSTISSTPELIIFPNRKNLDTAHVGITTSPITFIAVGDREILEEQKTQQKASSFQLMKHTAVGERISGLEETYPSDSSEDEPVTIERQATTKSTLFYRPAEVEQETRFRNPFQSGFDSRDEIILPDLIIQEDKIAPPDIFFKPEHDLEASELDYIESIDSSLSNTDTLFTESGAEQEENEVLKFEFRTPVSTQLSEHIHFIQPQQLSSNPTGVEVMNDEVNISERNMNPKTKLDFRVSQLKLPSLIRNTDEEKINELIDCDIVALNEDKCPIANDKSDQTRSDILFLIDTSHNISKMHFQQALKLITDTVEQFKNIGSDGIQISLIQFTRESVLEFSFHKHNCKPCLLADIGDTKYIGGLSTADNAIYKIIKYGFSKRRGDRDNAANILVVVSNGMSDGQFHKTLQLLHANNITMIIVFTADDTNPQLIKQLVKENKYRNLFFNVSAVDSDQLSGHLAERIRTVANEKTTSFGEIIAMETDELIQEFTAQCLRDGINATFKFLKSFGGIITVRSKNVTKSCSKVIQAEQFGEHIEHREVYFFISFKQCDVKKTISVNPSGMNYSALIDVIHDKWLVSGADKGFVVQCYQPQQSKSQEGNLRTDMNLRDNIKMANIFPLNSLPPLCNYSIRADAPNGPMIQSAKLGDIVYHKWECEDDQQTSHLYGIHIHDCYVESGTKQQHIIIDSNGCSADMNIVHEVIYSDNKLVAFAHVKVFKLINSEYLSFHCKLSLCIKKADGCEGITPPRCPRTGHRDLLVYHRNRYSTESFFAALTVQEEIKLTVIVPVNATDSAFSLQAVKELSNVNLLWLMVILIALSAAVLLLLIRYITKMDGKEEFIASENFKKHEIIDNIDYITSAVSTNAGSLSPIEKRVEERKDVCYSRPLKGIQSGKDKDKKMKTEIVSVSLNSIYDEIKSIAKCNSLCGTVSATASLHLQHDQRDGSSWSF
ncbi:unnamed protein product [Cercopithifilaria johnstoni]|uniref:VWFA domain-containing protein n=1 Tax=Cercopithifilaria johnstoni TaxID=2874296 RepID=A0A8J2MVY3_9BILA|nr:unnamed protein product [Cercopithifilaria johnstoni]